MSRPSDEIMIEGILDNHGRVPVRPKGEIENGSSCQHTGAMAVSNLTGNFYLVVCILER